jgi:CheY-like chemotaxis protein
VGVPPEKREEIFEAFTQADSSTTRKFGGTGLGLAISARLVGMMEGSIWVGTGPRERGSVFHFMVRLGMLQDRLPKPVVAQMEALQGLPVLIVDDNSTNRHLLTKLLSRWGLSPASVNSGGGALQLLRDKHAAGTPFRLVLLDFHMPGMDGLTAAELIRQEPENSGVPIVLLTSAGDSGIGARCRELSISSYLNKPILQSELRKAICTALGTEAPPQPDATPPTAVAPRPVQNSLRILLAEDNRVNQVLAVRLLEKRGHQVTVANDGMEALACAQDRSFDLALMDLEMPLRNGFEVTAAIREREAASGHHLPIVAMTAHAMKGVQDSCLAAGMDAYISKPIDPNRLYQLIGELGRSAVVRRDA